ncbi:hypothetical protein JW977_00510 [Candidatus Falkowbacteria bacterium]|nr:hypothetical protein [Candidatus Falkowbacteria bacterium]
MDDANATRILEALSHIHERLESISEAVKYIREYGAKKEDLHKLESISEAVNYIKEYGAKKS